MYTGILRCFKTFIRYGDWGEFINFVGSDGILVNICGFNWCKCSYQPGKRRKKGIVAILQIFLHVYPQFSDIDKMFELREICQLCDKC